MTDDEVGSRKEKKKSGRYNISIGEEEDDKFICSQKVAASHEEQNFYLSGNCRGKNVAWWPFHCQTYVRSKYLLAEEGEQYECRKKRVFFLILCHYIMMPVGVIINAF